jgi:hypothetical protein
MMCLLAKRVAMVLDGHKDSKDFSLLSALLLIYRNRQERIFIALTTDIDPRRSLSEFPRSEYVNNRTTAPIVVFSTFVLRRLQTKIKLFVVILIANRLKLRVGLLTSDGLSGLKVVPCPKNGFIVSQWFNEPEESDSFWKNRKGSIKELSRVEFFPPREGELLPSSRSVQRSSSLFNLMIPTEIDSHFPSTKRIVFASDIDITLRNRALEYQNRLQIDFSINVNLDEMLWVCAERRTSTPGSVVAFQLSEIIELDNFVQSIDASAKPTENEIDALRLTLHGRERYLYVRSLAESELSNELEIIGESWGQFQNLERHRSKEKRFPSKLEVHELQRSRVCPDFGSTLGSMPRYLRAEVLASRTIGLIQRRDPNGNPFLTGIEDRRTFNSRKELIDICRLQLNKDEGEIYEEALIIRANYGKELDRSIEKLTTVINSKMKDNDETSL